jgi:hypothetical protein
MHGDLTEIWYDAPVPVEATLKVISPSGTELGMNSMPLKEEKEKVRPNHKTALGLFHTKENHNNLRKYRTCRDIRIESDTSYKCCEMRDNR